MTVVSVDLRVVLWGITPYEAFQKEERMLRDSIFLGHYLIKIEGEDEVDDRVNIQILNTGE